MSILILQLGFGIAHLHEDLRPTYEDLSQVSSEQIGTKWKNLSM